MSILIKGMEMPHDCEECRLCAFIPVGDYGIHRKCLPLNANAEITIRRADCPLVPVPPHGRLIDADALIKSLSLDEDDEENGASLLMAIFIEVLKAAPTIIPAEEGNK